MARLSTIILLFLLAVVATVIATPVLEPRGMKYRRVESRSDTDPRDIATVDPATEAGIGSAILKVVQNVADALGGLFGGCGANEGATMAAYTKTTLDSLQKEFPEKNIMLVHPKHSANFDANAVHYHYELDTECFGRKVGYDAYVFDSGDFDLQGDGGWENWGFAGNYFRDKVNNGNHVHFDPIVRAVPPPPPPPPKVVPQVPTRANLSSTDGNYLVNCYKTGSTKSSSGVAYYKNIDPDGGNMNQLPDDYVDITHGDLTNWDGQGHVKFPSSGVTVSWSNYGGSRFSQKYDFTGTADNGYTYWNLYYDSGYLLYSTNNGWHCHSQYFMF